MNMSSRSSCCRDLDFIVDTDYTEFNLYGVSYVVFERMNLQNLINAIGAGEIDTFSKQPEDNVSWRYRRGEMNPLQWILMRNEIPYSTITQESLLRNLGLGVFANVPYEDI